MRLSLPEIKLLFLFCFFFLLITTALPATSLLSLNADRYNSSLYEYFDCESSGLPNNCSKSDFTQYTNSELSIVGVMLFSFTPAVQLVYVIEWRKAKQVLCHFLDDLARKLRLQKLFNPPLPVTVWVSSMTVKFSVYIITIHIIVWTNQHILMYRYTIITPSFHCIIINFWTNDLLKLLSICCCFAFTHTKNSCLSMTHTFLPV